MKTTFTIIFLICATLTSKLESQERPLVGLHGMAIFYHQGQWYGSHLPLANSIHSHQLIFSLEFENLDEFQNRQLKQLALAKKLVTIAPEVFDLMKFMNNKLTTFSGKLYQGHFERTGLVIAESVKIKVKKILLNEALDQSHNGDYYLVQTTTKHGLLVHKIGSSPSFDQILSFEFNIDPSSKQPYPKIVKLGNQRPLTQLEINNKLITITSEYYLETEDFR